MALRKRSRPLPRGSKARSRPLLRDDLGKQGMDLSDVVIHTFRHTCLTRMHKRGVPLEIVSKWAGHASVAITEKVYVKFDTSTLMRALAA